MSARSILLVLFLLAPAYLAPGQSLSRYVTDQTRTLDDAQVEHLENKLSAFAEATSTQIVVVVVSSTGSESVESASLRVAEENGVGQKGKNNGVVLFIAKDDKKIRIEVGYGLEGALTDIVSGEIIRYEIAPRFREGRFFEGIDAGVDAIMEATKNEYVADKSRGKSGTVNLLPIIFIFLAFLYFARMRRRRMGGFFPPVFFPGGGGFGRSSGGWGGGGFSGGGGSFGGGGASGGW